MELVRDIAEASEADYASFPGSLTMCSLSSIFFQTKSIIPLVGAL